MSNTSRTDHLASLREKIGRMSNKSSNGGGGNFQKDERYWKPELDKTGTGSAVIRFLNGKVGEDPFVRLYTHAFQGPTEKWFIDNCPSSIHAGVPSDACPVCADNNRLYNLSKDKEDPRKKLASSRKRKLNYISNILVVNDPKHPENNGKVFLFKYGVKIWNKITSALSPEFEDMEPIDPFSLDDGANFRLRVVKEDNFPNYDKSEFDKKTAAIGDADFIADVESQLHSLTDILDAKNFKSFDKLNERFTMVVAGGSTSEDSDEASSSFDEELPVVKPKVGKTVARTTGKTVGPKVAPKTATDDGDEENFFAKLAQSVEE